MSINWWIDDENMLCLQREFHSSVKKDEICKEKWKELENIIQSEVSQAQEEKFWMFSHMWS